MSFDVATRFTITAATPGIDAAVNAMGKIRGAAIELAGVLGVQLAAAAAVWKVADWAKGIVSGAAAIDDLSEATGASVENLSRLANQAEVSGKPFEELQSLMLKLSANIGGVDEQSRRAQRAMQLLGVSTRDPAQALNEIAVKLDEYRDGVEKAALAREIFGKSGPAFLATLKDIAEAQDIGATITRQQAADAERLEKGYRRLGIEATALKNALLSDLVPALATSLEAFRIARSEGESFWSALDFIGDNTLESVQSRLGDVRKKIDDLQKDIAQASTKMADPVFGVRAQQEMERATALLQEYTARYRTLVELQSRMLVRSAGDVGGDQVSRSTQIAAGAELRKLMGDLGSEKPKAKVDEFARALEQVKNKAIEAEIALEHAFDAEPITEAEKELEKLFASDLFARAPKDWQVAMLVWYDSIIQSQKGLQAAKKSTDELARSEKELAAIREELESLGTKRLQAMDDETSALIDQLDQLKAEGETIGLTKTQLDALTLSRLDAKIAALAQAAAARESVAGMDAETAAMYSQLQVLQQFREQTASNQASRAIVEYANEAQEAWQRAADSIQKSLTDALLRGFEGGASFARNFRDTLVNMFKTLVLRPVIQAIVTPLAGGLAGLMPGSAGASALGGGGDLMSLLSTGGSLFGGGGSSLLGAGGISGLFAGSGGIFGAGAIGNSFALSGVGQALGLSAVGLDMAGGVALTGLGTALGAAIPILGAALAIASLAGVFDKDPSQVLGTFGVRAGAGGFEDNAYTPSKYGNLGFLDDGTQYFGGEAAQVFNQVVGKTLDAIGSRLSGAQNASLAGRLQGMSFGTFEGEYTTEDFIKKYGAEILGKVISAGLEELDPKLQAVFDAFQGTADEMATFANVLLQVHDASKNIPSDLRDTLLAALDGTEEMSQRVLALTTAYATLQDIMNRDPLEDALDAVASASMSAYGQLGKTADAFEDLMRTFDGSADASKKIAQASVDYYNALVQVIAGIEQLRASIGSMFDDTIRDLTLQTLDDPGKKTWYRDQISQLYGQLGTASDPAEVDRITRQINEYMRAAFGLLTPEEQHGLLQQYIDFANQVQHLADQRLAAAEEVAQARAEQLFSQLRDVLSGAASDMKGAGGDMKAAAADMKAAASASLAAAREPLVISMPDPAVNA